MAIDLSFLTCFQSLKKLGFLLESLDRGGRRRGRVCGLVDGFEAVLGIV